MALSEEEIDFETFNIAKELAAREVPGTSENDGTPIDDTVMREEGYSFDTYGRAARQYGRPTFKQNSAHQEPRALLRYEVNGVLSLDQTFAAMVNKLTEVAPGSFVFRRLNGKLGIKLPDSETPPSQQAVITITEEDLISPIQATQNQDHHNRAVISYPSACLLYTSPSPRDS